MAKVLILISFLQIVIFSHAQSDCIEYTLSDLNPNNFSLDFREYNRKNAIFCAQLSNIVYEPEGSIKRFVEELNLKYPQANYKCQFIQDIETSTEVLIFGNEYFVIVAFRGTKELKDFKTDAKFLGYKTLVDRINDNRYEYIPIGHAGFRKSLMSIIRKDKEDLIGKLKVFINDSIKQQIENIPVFLTGHSLGGALSHMFILPLKLNKFNYSGGYNFAPPLAIWKDDALKMRADSSIFNVTYDIVNNTDYITRLPMYSRINMGHIGKFYRICYSDKDRLFPEIYREDELFFKYKIWEKFTVIKALFDKYHRMAYYLKAVSDNKNSNERIIERSGALETCSCLGVKKEKCNQ